MLLASTHDQTLDSNERSIRIHTIKMTCLIPDTGMFGCSLLAFTTSQKILRGHLCETARNCVADSEFPELGLAIHLPELVASR